MLIVLRRCWLWPEVLRWLEAKFVVWTGDVTIALSCLPTVSNVPELATPADDELRVLVVDPGVPVPHQGVGDRVAPQLVEVDHPQPVVRLRCEVQFATARTATWKKTS